MQSCPSSFLPTGHPPTTQWAGPQLSVWEKTPTALWPAIQWSPWQGVTISHVADLLGWLSNIHIHWAWKAPRAVRQQNVVMGPTGLGTKHYLSNLAVSEGPVSEWVPAWVTPGRGGVTRGIQTFPLIEEEAPFQNTLKSWKEQKYRHGSWQDPKPRLTVLVKATSNLPDRQSGPRVEVG
jgi:hypothetical protein